MRPVSGARKGVHDGLRKELPHNGNVIRRCVVRFSPAQKESRALPGSTGRESVEKGRLCQKFHRDAPCETGFCAHQVRLEKLPNHWIGNVTGHARVHVLSGLASGQVFAQGPEFSIVSGRVLSRGDVNDNEPADLIRVLERVFHRDETAHGVAQDCRILQRV